MIASFAPLFPEIGLSIAALVLLLAGVFRGNVFTLRLTLFAVLALFGTMYLVAEVPHDRALAMNSLFVTDAYAKVVKQLILAGAILVLLATLDNLKHKDFSRFEYPVLIVLAVIGMLVMVSANNLMTLYVGLELQSLSLYVLAAFKRDDTQSAEAGLKYFVLGALASGIFLFGASLIYGFTGTLGFDGLAEYFQNQGTAPISGAVVIGLVFMIVAFCFKASAVPFHMWTPDVYQGAPTPVTAFFAVAPKVAALALFTRVLMQPFGDAAHLWQQVILLVSVLSMIVGALAAIQQTSIKRLMAYSSIGHVGYILAGLATATQNGVEAILQYLLIYLVMSAGTFACIMHLRRSGKAVDEISDLAGLSKTQPGIAAALLIFMFSMAGIPPMAGFWGKLAVFLAVMETGMVWLAVLALLLSVISAYYYLRIVKVMYIDESGAKLDTAMGFERRLVIAGTALFTLLFFFVPTPVMEWVKLAAASLVL